MASLRDGVADYVLREGLAAGEDETTWDRTTQIWRASDIPCPECPARVGVECNPESPKRPYCLARMRALADKRDELEPELVAHVPKYVQTTFNPSNRNEREAAEQRKRGSTNGGRKSSISNEQAATMARKQDAGVRVTDIAGEYQVSVSTVKLRIKLARESGWV